MSDEPVNVKLGMSYYGDEGVFKSMLANYDAMQLDPQTKAVHDSWKAANWSIMERDVRKVKSGCG